MTRITVRFYNHDDATRAAELFSGKVLYHTHVLFEIHADSAEIAMDHVADNLKIAGIEWRDAEF